MDARNKLFISYSHEDTKWLNAIKEQLAVLEAEGLVSLCEDTQLPDFEIRAEGRGASPVRAA